MESTDSPFRPGDRVRCIAATAATHDGLELYGRLGTVHHVSAGVDDTGLVHWQMTVDWDGIVALALFRHPAAELALADEPQGPFNEAGPHSTAPIS
jgi:hypothetical protein